MTTITHVTAKATFIDVIVADDAWVRAEFDAIVSAEEWGRPDPPGSSPAFAGLPGESDLGPTPGDPEEAHVRALLLPHQPRAAERSPPRPLAVGDLTGDR